MGNQKALLNKPSFHRSYAGCSGVSVVLRYLRPTGYVYSIILFQNE